MIVIFTNFLFICKYQSITNIRILQCTEDNSSDKVKLLMALKIMNAVAQTLNESKRRKDLGKSA